MPLGDLQSCWQTANNGQEALDLVNSSSNNFDLILMDVNMPVMGGIEAAQKIRQQNPQG